MRVTLAVLAAAVLLVAGCGSDAPNTSTAAGATTTTPTAGPATPGDCVGASTNGSGPIPGLTGDAKNVTKQATVAIGGTNPPTELKTADIVEGTGPVAKPTDTVKVQYTGVFYCDGATFDSSWQRGQPASFSLQKVVPGFTQGITGMKAGGRREIVIPPALGYGDQAQGPVPAGSTLVFVVDLVGIS